MLAQLRAASTSTTTYQQLDVCKDNMPPIQAAACF
jgi:hypothetical protein